jgi:hypothetical protein
MVCLICLETIDEVAQQYKVKFCCKQTYHFDCIKTWTDSKLTCPICRKLLSQKTLNLLRNIQNNIKEIKLKEERAQHIIETFLLDIQNIKTRTQHNLNKLTNLSSFTQPPEIPSAPLLTSGLNFSRLLHRRGAVVLPLMITEDCRAPAFCRCTHCAPISPRVPRWN